MGTRERREREKRQQRQKILDAALEIISQEGYAALSMRKLAERIEYSAASIYLYFASREQIAQELSEAGFEELLGAIEAATFGKQAAEALYALGAAYVAFALKYPEIYRLIFMGDSEYMSVVYAENRPDNASAKAYGMLVELAQQLQDAGIASKETELPVIAETILCMLHGVVSLRITCAGALSSSPEELVRLATETLVRGLNGASARPPPNLARSRLN